MGEAIGAVTGATTGAGVRDRIVSIVAVVAGFVGVVSAWAEAIVKSPKP